jgi:hypothetical protein
MQWNKFICKDLCKDVCTKLKLSNSKYAFCVVRWTAPLEAYDCAKFCTAAHILLRYAVYANIKRNFVVYLQHFSTGIPGKPFCYEIALLQTSTDIQQSVVASTLQQLVQGAGKIILALLVSTAQHWCGLRYYSKFAYLQTFHFSTVRPFPYSKTKSIITTSYLRSTIFSCIYKNFIGDSSIFFPVQRFLWPH